MKLGRLVGAGLLAGVAAPAVYFLVQLVAAQRYGSYDWATRLASELGQVGAPSSRVFNAGMALSGLLTMVAAPAFSIGLYRSRSGKLAPLLVGATLISGGAATVWAALHPLPSALHNPGLWGFGTVLFPAVLAWATRNDPRASGLRAYLLISFAVALALLVWIEWAQTSDLAGVLQRVAAAMVYPPVAVGAAFVLRSMRG